MGTWIEFRCENRSEASADGASWPGKRCWSHDNEGPMDMALDTRASVVETLQGMERHAIASGWKKTRDGWICPFCAQQREQPHD